MHWESLNKEAGPDSKHQTNTSGKQRHMQTREVVKLVCCVEEASVHLENMKHGKDVLAKKTAEWIY